MLERYFLRPATIDQIRASWIADAIERYVVSLTERGYAARNFHARIPILRHFGDFARDHGATSLAQLPAHVTPFVETWLRDRERIRAHPEGRRRFANEVRGRSSRCFAWWFRASSAAGGRGGRRSRLRPRRRRSLPPYARSEGSEMRPSCTTATISSGSRSICTASA